MKIQEKHEHELNKLGRITKRVMEINPRVLNEC